MNAVGFALGLIGAFYTFAGWLATRVGLTSLLMDYAIAAISAKKPNAAEVAQSTWLIAASYVIFLGGMALLLRLNVAMWLFLASALAQAFYLTWLAPRFFDRGDPPDPAGRGKTRNAFVLYLVATAFVVWAGSSGELLGWRDVPGPLLAAAGAAAVAQLGYILWMTAGPGSMRRPATVSSLASFDDDPPDPSLSRSVKVMADYHSHPLWAMDDGMYGNFAPEQLGLSAGLTADLKAWADAFTASLNPDEPSQSLWTDEQHRAHRAEGRPLAARLAQERPDLKIYVRDDDGYIVEARADA